MMHTIYKLTVGGVPYFGFTSRDPNVRLREHLDVARANNYSHNSLLYPALAAANFQYDFEVVMETTDELEALFTEIMLIRKTPKTLNLTKGGEGATLNVKIEEKGKPRRINSKKRPKRRRKYRRL